MTKLNYIIQELNKQMDNATNSNWLKLANDYRFAISQIQQIIDKLPVDTDFEWCRFTSVDKLPQNKEFLIIDELHKDEINVVTMIEKDGKKVLYSKIHRYTIAPQRIRYYKEIIIPNE